MKSNNSTLVVMICLSLVCVFWAPLMNLAGAKLVANLMYDAIAFCLGAIVLGKWLLGQRDYWDANGNTTECDRRIWILILWSFGLAACVIPLYPTTWPISVATGIGMIIGSIIWPPKSWIVPVDDNDPEPRWSPTCPDEAALRATDVPDMTQNVQHPDQ